MFDNSWGVSTYPLVGGHEAVGRVVAVGVGVDPALIGQLRGVGWFCGSCGHCDACVAGRANLCDTAQGTIVGRPGAFASQVKAQQD
ncbi:MAG: alcohol dehydrogenase catalytic domain-containing protein, partial [Cyanobacteriota bacterium]